MDFFKNKRILITGHTGFKGSWLSKILSFYQADVLGYSLKSNTEPSLYEILKLDNQVKSIIGDIRDFDNLKKVILDFKPEIIFHLAGEAIVQNANENPLYAYESNTRGTVNLLEAIRYCDSVKSVIIVSTDSVYEKQENKYIYYEEDKIKGENTYSNSKCGAELIVENYKNIYFKNLEYPRISITRSVNVIGGGDFNYSRIIPTCIKSWINKEKIELREPKNIKSFLHVLEVLYGYLLLAKQQYLNKDKEGIYNFSPDDKDYCFIEEVVSLTFNKLNMGDELKEIIDKENIKKTCNNKAKEKLNWEPVLTFDERLDKVIEWYKALIRDEDIIELTQKQIEEFFNKENIKNM